MGIKHLDELLAKIDSFQQLYRLTSQLLDEMDKNAEIVPKTITENEEAKLEKFKGKAKELANLALIVHKNSDFEHKFEAYTQFRKAIDQIVEELKANQGKWFVFRNS